MARSQWERLKCSEAAHDSLMLDSLWLDLFSDWVSVSEKSPYRQKLLLSSTLLFEHL